MVISTIVKTIQSLYRRNRDRYPEMLIYLNDLTDNDFNAVFKMLPSFYRNFREDDGNENVIIPCFVSATPGSFYSRLFPSNSLHFVHSSNSLHWLSQAPGKLENRGNVYISRTSPARAAEAYLKQFEKDFSTFLRLRSEEMMAGGHVLLTLAGRSDPNPSSDDCCCLWELLSKSLLELVSEGHVREEDVDSFNFPFYNSYKDEVKAIIEKEKSFSLERLEVFQSNWDVSDNDNDGDKNLDKCERSRNVASRIRALSEPMLAAHFGDLIIEDLFKKYAKHVEEYLSLESLKNTSIVVSLRKL
ncbi:hypothetical protein NMG60_11008309 [Bertholletia excelsa]